MRKTVKILFLLLGVVCLSGCRPRGVLSSAQMREVIYDLHRADAVLNVTGYTQGGYEKEMDECYQSVMAKHGITQAKFDSSLVWYTNHPALFDKIYPKLEARVEAEENYWTEREEREKRLAAVRDGHWRDGLPDEIQVALWNMKGDCPSVIPPLEVSDFGDFQIKMRLLLKKTAK